jgi:DNA modification methylase
MVNYSSKIIDDFSKLSCNEEWSFRDAGRSETNSDTHGYHRYPAKFIPQIARKLITDYTSQKDSVCDIFGGCGTTLVEAKLLGRKSVGFDINPVAKLITQVKVSAILPESLEKAREQYDKNYSIITTSQVNHHQRLNHWFDQDTLVELDKIYQSINTINDAETRRFFLCAFSHNLKTSSKWLMKSIKPTVDRDKTVAPPNLTFLRQVDSMIIKNKLFYEKLVGTNRLGVMANMYQRDSTKKLPVLNDSKDIVISSPPYVTSYEYADLHQLSILWFGDDPLHFKRWGRLTKDYDDFRKTFIGSSFIRKHRVNFGSDIAKKIVNDLSLEDKSLAGNVANYFVDTQKAFTEIKRILKPQGKVCLILGNTNLCGVNILNAEVAAEQMIYLGFKKHKYIKREVPNKKLTPWRDAETGKFTSIDNQNKIRAYEYEYILVMKKT